MLAVPSTYVQSDWASRAEGIELSTEPAGFVLHAVVDGELVSHVTAGALALTQALDDHLKPSCEQAFQVLWSRPLARRSPGSELQELPTRSPVRP